MNIDNISSKLFDEMATDYLNSKYESQYEEGLPKPIRCGACGMFMNIDADEIKLYTKEELDNAELDHCGCEVEQEQRRVTKDMAIDAGDLSLEGQVI